MSVAVGADAAERVVRLRYLPWQREVRRDVLVGGARTVVLACGARSGKDVLSDMMVVELALRLSLERRARGVRLSPLVNVWVVAPRDKLWRQTWNELVEMIPAELVEGRALEAGEMRLRGGIRISFRSAHDPEMLVAEGVDILVFTEASRSRASSTVWAESLVPRLASPGRMGLAMLNGTPRCGKRHWYRMLWEQARAGGVGVGGSVGAVGAVGGMVERNLPTSCNPMMAGKLCELAEKMPERLFRTEILAEWPDDDEAPFRQSDVDALVVDEGGRVEPPVVHGLDIGRYRDATAGVSFAAGAGDVAQVVDSLRLVRTRHAAQVGRVTEWVSRRPGLVVMDATGAGAFMADSLEDTLPHGTVRRVDLNGGRKEVLVDALIAGVEGRGFVLRRDLLGEEMTGLIRGQLLDYEAEVTDDGRVDYHGPGGERDDFVIALALGWSRASRCRVDVDSWGVGDVLRRFF